MQAILITAYKNIQHLEEIASFFGNDYNIYIHIDKKSTIDLHQIESLSSKKNVKYISRQYKINWGGFNHLLAILDITRKAYLDKENKYFHLITGHDFPIKPLSDFDRFYRQNSDRDFLEYHSLPYDAWPENGLDRLSRYNLYDLIDGRTGWKEIVIKRISKIQKLLHIRRRFPKNFPMQYGGSTYWSLKRESMKYIFAYMENNPWYLKRFKYTFCAEEIFFQTILINSPLKENIVNNNMRFIVWENRNGNFPANLDMSDYDLIKHSDALFARKFEYPASELLLSFIKKNILHINE